MSSSIQTIHGVPHSAALRIDKAFQAEKRKRLTMIESAKQSGRTLVGTVGAVGFAAAVGGLRGYKDMSEIGGMPIDGVGGAACLVAAFFVDGRSESDALLREALTAAGNVGIGLFVAREAEEWGRKKANE